MKALFVTHSFPRFDGDAAGSFILRLAVALRERSIDVRVIAPGARGLASSEVIQGVEIRRFRYAPRSHETLAYRGTMAEDVARSASAKLALTSFVASETLAVRREAAAWKPDLIHAHWWFPNGIAAATASRLSHIPLVTTSHGTDLRLLRSKPAARPLARFVLRRSAGVTCVSTWLARQAAPFSRTTPVVAPMPIDIDAFGPLIDTEARDHNRIIFVGRLSEQKGIALALRALSLMRPGIVLDVVGDGPDRVSLQQLALELGVADRVLWRGHVSHSEIPALLARAAVLVAPFTDEGLGLVAAEAQLCETPPIAFDSGGITDVINDGSTGVLVPVGDVTALAAAVERVVTQPELRDRLGQTGRHAALATFSPSAVAARYQSVYREATANHAL